MGSQPLTFSQSATQAWASATPNLAEKARGPKCSEPTYKVRVMNEL